ncbi:MAG: redoxin domain-containing protein, partial [Bacteroidaceae bacterium]|nr:redoxin domain-containing protein [Bacteroidaceae bacterium]
MRRNLISILAAAAVIASCGGDKKASGQVAEQPVVENAVAEQVVYENEYIVKVGDVAPDFTLPMTDGSTFTLSEQRGKVVMLQFTAGWCGV